MTTVFFKLVLLVGEKFMIWKYPSFSYETRRVLSRFSPITPIKEMEL
jgi:hypothetical protein